MMARVIDRGNLILSLVAGIAAGTTLHISAKVLEMTATGDLKVAVIAAASVAVSLYVICLISDTEAEAVLGLLVEVLFGRLIEAIGGVYENFAPVGVAILSAFSPIWGPIALLFVVVYNLLQRKEHLSEEFYIAPAHGSMGHQPRALIVLKCFRWFCDRENRQHVEIIMADLTADVTQMKKEGHGEYFIQLVLWWRVLIGTILPITKDGIVRAWGSVAKLIGATVWIAKS